MTRAVLLVAMVAACVGPVALEPPALIDPDLVCRPAPTIAGLEWIDCDAAGDVRTCRYLVGRCRIVLLRRDCDAAWTELARECRMPLLRQPGERDS